jgi:FkbM family methyltransferase
LRMRRSRVARARLRMRRSRVAEAAGCPLAPGLDSARWKAALKDRALHAAIPPARALVRYGKPGERRERLWRDRVEPYLAWHSHRFMARTVFGARIEGDTQEILQQHVYFFGVWEPNLTRWLESRLRPGDTFVDVGANVGYFSLLASSLVGQSGSVKAIEASPTLHRRLCANIERNRARNVEALNRIAAAERGMRGVYLGPDSHTGLTTINADHGFAEEAQVEAGTVPELVGERAWQAARVVKIDVEAAEDEVVRGLAPALARTREDVEVVVELHPGAGRDVFPAFADAGFHPYALEIDYSPLAYDRTGPVPIARRLPGAIEGELDIVFSRADTDELQR